MSNRRILIAVLVLSLQTGAPDRAASESASAAVPTEVEPIIVPGKRLENSDRLTPFRATYRETNQGQTLGQRLVHLDQLVQDGEPMLRHTIELRRSGSVTDEVLLEGQTLQPVFRSVIAPGMLYKSEVWTAEVVRGAVLTPEGESEPWERPLAGKRFNAPSLAIYLALQSLQVGDQRTFAVFSSDLPEGTGNALQSIEVLGRETLEVGGASFDTWVVRSRFLAPSGDPLMPPATLWLAEEPPYEIRSDFGSLRIDLESVEVDG